MKQERLWYGVTAEVSFSEREVEFLIEQAKRHYDMTCQAAGLTCDDGVPKNGFIAILRMFGKPGDRRDTWTFRQFDTCLKILEIRSDDEFLRMKLANEMNAVCDKLNEEYTRLNGRR